MSEVEGDAVPIEHRRRGKSTGVTPQWPWRVRAIAMQQTDAVCAENW
jgi:hypothetical protein